MTYVQEYLHENFVKRLNGGLENCAEIHKCA
jgi:hypothetical protein